MALLSMKYTVIRAGLDLRRSAHRRMAPAQITPIDGDLQPHQTERTRLEQAVPSAFSLPPASDDGLPHESIPGPPAWLALRGAESPVLPAQRELRGGVRRSAD